MSLHEELRAAFSNEHGPLINELLAVLHYMGCDEATKGAFCRQVVMKGGEKFWSKFQAAANLRFADAEEKYSSLAALLEASAPRHMELKPIA